LGAPKSSLSKPAENGSMSARGGPAKPSPRSGATTKAPIGSKTASTIGGGLKKPTTTAPKPAAAKADDAKKPDLLKKPAPARPATSMGVASSRMSAPTPTKTVSKIGGLKAPSAVKKEEEKKVA